MDSEALIRCVALRRPLWDKNDKKRRNLEICRQLWEEVAKELNVKVGAAKSKWRGLRDTFRKEVYKSQEKYPNVKGELVKTSWPYFEDMMFVYEVLFPKEKDNDTIKQDSYIEESSIDIKENNIELEEISSINAHDEEFAPEVYMTEPVIKRKKISTNNEFTNTSTNITQNNSNDSTNQYIDVSKIKYSSNYQDADYHFLMSLLPFLRDVPDKRKLFVRAKLQQVFFEENNITTTLFEFVDPSSGRGSAE